ncbi:unnamed protein product [Fusarium graminearum]|uniref:Chromosome 1, complete genome n=1 Tax=Gibberella zeae (strain ATCC MYA-4620 / CBS 123657 / FGSC 9075 / NRRL 31084 / PH-1) TaxID=229533 RepID=A0A098DAC7_GIBZE|nr:unnamed protein product [Fusarium graminearum]
MCSLVQSRTVLASPHTSIILRFDTDNNIYRVKLKQPSNLVIYTLR